MVEPIALDGPGAKPPNQQTIGVADLMVGLVMLGSLQNNSTSDIDHGSVGELPHGSISQLLRRVATLGADEKECTSTAATDRAATAWGGGGGDSFGRAIQRHESRTYLVSILANRHCFLSQQSSAIIVAKEYSCFRSALTLSTPYVILWQCLCRKNRIMVRS